MASRNRRGITLMPVVFQSTKERKSHGYGERNPAHARAHRARAYRDSQVFSPRIDTRSVVILADAKREPDRAKPQEASVGRAGRGPCLPRPGNFWKVMFLYAKWR